MAADMAFSMLLADAAIKGTVVLAVAGVAAFAFRRAAAATRHALWTLAALALLLAPVLSVTLPSWDIPLYAPDARGAGFLFSTGVLVTDGGSGGAGLKAVAMKEAVPPADADRRKRLSHMAFWLAGVAASLAWYLAGFGRAWWLSRGARRFGPERRAVIAEAAAQIGLETAPPVRLKGVVMPMTWGIARPEVVLPEEAEGWPEDRLRVVLLHEFAHVRRRDCLTQALMRMAASLYWFHPLAWFAARRSMKERERACDDMVLAAGARASEYASHLLGLARAFQPAGAGLAMARRTELEGRLLAILDGNARRGPLARAAAAVMAIAAIGLVIAVSAMHPVEAKSPALAQGGTASYEQLEQQAEAARHSLDFAAAETHLRRALDLRSQRFGEASAEYARGAAKLADLLSYEGKTSEAEPLWQRVLAAQESLFGREGTPLAATLYQLGVAAQVKQETAAAEQLYQRAASILTRAGITGDPLAGRIETKLGVLYERLGRSGDAELHYTQAVAALDKAAPGDAAATLEFYSRFLRNNGRIPEAESSDAKAKRYRELDLQEIKDRLGAGAKSAVGEAQRVGPGMAPPRLISKVEPAYSADARLAKCQGTAVLSVVIGIDGLARDIRIVRGLGLGLDLQAIAAIRQWKFEPAVKDGSPVPVMATIEINFRLM